MSCVAAPPREAVSLPARGSPVRLLVSGAAGHPELDEEALYQRLELPFSRAQELGVEFTETTGDLGVSFQGPRLRVNHVKEARDFI